MLISRMKGSGSAARFLKEHFGIDKSLGFEFSEIEDTVIYNNCDVEIEFGGIQTDENKIEFKFWIFNRSNNQYNLWVKNLSVNETNIVSFKKIGEFAAGTDYAIIAFDYNLSLEDTIHFYIQIDNSDDIAICETNKLQIRIDKKEIKPVFEIVGILQSPSINIQHLIDKNTTLLHSPEIEVVFDGFRIMNGTAYLCVLSKNTSKSIKRINFDYLKIDEKTVKYDFFPINELIVTNGTWERTYFPFYRNDLNCYHRFEISIGIYDFDKSIIDNSKRFKIGIDFSDGFIYSRFSDEDNYEEDNSDSDIEQNEDIADEVYDYRPLDARTFFSNPSGENTEFIFSMDPEDLANYLRNKGYNLFTNYDVEQELDMSLFETSVSIRNSIRRAMKYL